MKKILVVGLVLILFGMISIPSISAAERDAETPSDKKPCNQPLLIIEIDGFSVTITNIGNESAFNIEVHMWFEGMVFVGSAFTSTKESLGPGESMTVGPGLVFGFGPVIFHVEVTYDGMIEPVTASVKGFMLGPFFFVLQH